MKKILLVLIIVLMFSLTACNNNEKEDQPKDENEKVLVVYYSASGNTKKVAEYIKEKTNATIVEMVPVNQYSTSDLNYRDQNSRVVREYNDENLRDIELVTTQIEDFDSYTIVFIGYPIWWQIAAWPINNFVKNNDFTGKTVIPFATSSSSGIGQSGKLLENLTNTENWKQGQRFSSSASKSTVSNWIKDLNL